jgi:hypothetical protein
MKDILKIQGGNAVVKDMLIRYKELYPGRRLMHEMLGKII